MDEQRGIALEVEASEELTEAEVADRAKDIGASLAVVTDGEETVGVLEVEQLDSSTQPVIEAARSTPAITEHTVTVSLPHEETVEVYVQVQGMDLVIWDRGHERLLMPLDGRDVADALTSRVEAFAATNAAAVSFAVGDIILPRPGLPPIDEPPSHTYMCSRRHYEWRASGDPDRTCRVNDCGHRLYRV